MWLLYLVLLFVVVGAHAMLYVLFKAGVEESKKPVPEHIKRRRPTQLHTVLAPRFRQQSNLDLWPAL